MKVNEDGSSAPELKQPLQNHAGAAPGKGPSWWRSCRYLLALMEFSGVAILFFQRNHLSVAIICMVNHTAVDIRYRGLTDLNVINHNSSGHIQYANMSYSTTNHSAVFVESDCRDVQDQKKEDGEFVWSRDVQGLLLGAMYWSYVVMQIPGAVFTDRFLTAKIGTTFPIAVITLLNFLTPVAASLSPWAVLASRLVVGAFAAQYIVAFNQIWRKWAPPGERSRLMSLSFSGVQFANAFVFPISALLCRSSIGWPAVFYCFACMGVVWCVLSLVLVYESPDVHPRISPEERDYIVSAIANSTSKQRKDSIPWKQILTSVPLWAISIAAFTFNLGNYLLMTTLPMFMREVLKFDIKSNGFFSMLPFLAAWMVIYVAGFISDSLIQRKILSVVGTRKVVYAVGQITCASCFVAMSFLDCHHQGAAVALLTMAVGSSSTSFASLPINYFDVAPRYAAICLAIGNTLCVVPGFLAPVMVAELTKEQTREAWQRVFFIVAAILVFGTLVFSAFGQGTVQSWAAAKPTEMTIGVELNERVPSLKATEEDEGESGKERA